jgi:uncharacterized protein (TIGR02246 family)
LEALSSAASAISGGFLTSSDETAIRNLVSRWIQASEAGDLDTALGLMADDVVFMFPGREPFGKEAFRAQSAGMKDRRMQ